MELGVYYRQSTREKMKKNNKKFLREDVTGVTFHR